MALGPVHGAAGSYPDRARHPGRGDDPAPSEIGKRGLTRRVVDSTKPLAPVGAVLGRSRTTTQHSNGTATPGRSDHATGVETYHTCQFRSQAGIRDNSTVAYR